MRVMGIETSCDETAVAIVEAPAVGGPPGNGSLGQILANVVYSQLTEHRRFGGVVPEIAARAHLERIDGLVEEAVASAFRSTKWSIILPVSTWLATRT